MTSVKINMVVWHLRVQWLYDVTPGEYTTRMALYVGKVVITCASIHKASYMNTALVHSECIIYTQSIDEYSLIYISDYLRGDQHANIITHLVNESKQGGFHAQVNHSNSVIITSHIYLISYHGKYQLYGQASMAPCDIQWCTTRGQNDACLTYFN